MSADYLNIEQLIEKLQQLKEDNNFGEEPVFFCDSSGYNYFVTGVIIDTDGTLVIE